MVTLGYLKKIKKDNLTNSEFRDDIQKITIAKEWLYEMKEIFESVDDYKELNG